MRLSDMLIRVTEYQPRGVILLSEVLAGSPELVEVVEWLANFNPNMTPADAWAGGMNWVLDAILNYGVPADLELLPRDEVRS